MFPVWCTHCFDGMIQNCTVVQFTQYVFKMFKDFYHFFGTEKFKVDYQYFSSIILIMHFTGMPLKFIIGWFSEGEKNNIV